MTYRARSGPDGLGCWVGCRDAQCEGCPNLPCPDYGSLVCGDNCMEECPMGVINAYARDRLPPEDELPSVACMARS